MVPNIKQQNRNVNYIITMVPKAVAVSRSGMIRGTLGQRAAEDRFQINSIQVMDAIS
jgi:hypothetical protein